MGRVKTNEYDFERGPGVQGKTDPDDPRLERRRIGGLVLLCLLLFFFRLGGHFLWDIDEACTR